MRYEISSGGVIISPGRIPQVLLLKDKSGNWTFPKGLVEKGDSDKQTTAKREIAEEVGITDIRYLTDLKPAEYWYKWEGELTKKKVYYFLFSADRKTTPKPQREEGILEARWFTFSKAAEIIGYRKTNTLLLKQATAYLAKQKAKSI